MRRSTTNHGEEHYKPWEGTLQTMGRNTTNHDGNIP